MPAFGLLDTWEGAARRGLVEPRADERGASPGTSSSSSARRSTGRACWSRAPPAPENRPSSCASPRRAAATTLSSSSICGVIFPRSSVTSKRSRASTRGRWSSSPASRWSARRRSSCRTRSRKSTSDGRHRPVRAALPPGQKRSDHLSAGNEARAPLPEVAKRSKLAGLSFGLTIPKDLPLARGATAAGPTAAAPEIPTASARSTPAPPPLTLEQHASLCADLAFAPEREAEILARYRLSAESKLLVDQYYRERVEESAEVHAAWDRGYRAYYAWLADAATRRR